MVLIGDDLLYKETPQGNYDILKHPEKIFMWDLMSYENSDDVTNEPLYLVYFWSVVDPSASEELGGGDDGAAFHVDSGPYRADADPCQVDIGPYPGDADPLHAVADRCHDEDVPNHGDFGRHGGDGHCHDDVVAGCFGLLHRLRWDAAPWNPLVVMICWTVGF